FASVQKSLLGTLPLFIGMPVILRNWNLSVKLGVTNGAPGIVHHIQVKVDEFGYHTPDVVIVEFPTSTIELNGLPPRCYPITPETWRVEYQRSITQPAIKLVRRQFPIQPAFAVTGHSAQGKTLLSVICSLKDGRFAAYVAASRPRRRQDLAISKEVSPLDLNKPLPQDLIEEMNRLNVIAHNTDIEYGCKSGVKVTPPDTEALRNIDIYEGLTGGYIITEPSSEEIKSNKRKN
ncbi:hypothetical protein AAF712_016132, partial [Marasmius tenuissimus]